MFNGKPEKHSDAWKTKLTLPHILDMTYRLVTHFSFWCCLPLRTWQISCTLLLTLPYTLDMTDSLHIFSDTVLHFEHDRQATHFFRHCLTLCPDTNYTAWHKLATHFFWHRFTLWTWQISYTLFLMLNYSGHDTNWLHTFSDTELHFGHHKLATDFFWQLNQ